MRGDQSDSDPLPYTQVDRSAKPKATLVAGTINCTPQHALGSLLEYWDLNGDPRDLERILLSTPAGEKPVVLVSAEQAATRFRLASGGKEFPAESQVALGLLEQRDGGRFRVRGMSRYFGPVIKRIAARQAAVAGGKASAEKRRAKYGTAQPPGGKGSENRSDLGSDGRSDVASDPLRTASEPEPKREPKRNGTDDRSGTEADRKPSGQRSDHRSLKETIAGSKTDSQADSPEFPPSSGESASFLPDPDPGPLMQRLWNGITRAPVPKVAELNEARTKKAKSRWKDHPSEGFWRTTFERVMASPFLRGDTSKFKATFDWILEPSNLLKVLEGNYDEHGQSTQPSNGGFHHLKPGQTAY